jgi:hypothetical protein
MRRLEKPERRSWRQRWLPEPAIVAWGRRQGSRRGAQAGLAPAGRFRGCRPNRCGPKPRNREWRGAGNDQPVCRICDALCGMVGSRSELVHLSTISRDLLRRVSPGFAQGWRLGVDAQVGSYLGYTRHSANVVARAVT